MSATTQSQTQPVCACKAIRTDYGTGVEYDVDPSSCPIHADDDERSRA